ncbi:MAG: tetratricopeptide repeat protein [Vicinamibacterales bacterium]
MDIPSLEQKAIDFAKRGDFGVDAQQANKELTQLAPANQGGWTRLARCCIELGLLDDANAALEKVLALNPQNMIARSLLQESIRREVRREPAEEAASTGKRTGKAKKGSKSTGPARTGFGRPQFAALGQLAPASALESLGPAIESLLMAVNECPFAGKIVEARNRAGQSGSKLFRRNSFYAGKNGTLYVFHHGGRSEPQVSLGFFASPQFGRDSVRAGIGFNLAQSGPDKDAGQERAMAYFERFQRLVAGEWKQLLTGWMTNNGGFIQYGDKPPLVDMMPADAISSLVNAKNTPDLGWVFVGRSLSPDRAADAEILSDQSELVKWVEQTVEDLLPLWMSVYREVEVS